MLTVEILTQDEELAAACRMYWQVDEEWRFDYRVDDLAKLTNIESPRRRLPQTIREACYAYVKGWNCTKCENPHKFYVRSDLPKHNSDIGKPMLCSECKEQERIQEAAEERKRVEDAERSRQEIRTRIRGKIRERHDLSKTRPVSHVYNLSLTDAVYLISIMRGAYEDLTKIKPIDLFEQPLAATSDLKKEIILQAHDNGLIFVHPDSETDAFLDETLDRFYLYKSIMHQWLQKNLW